MRYILVSSLLAALLVGCGGSTAVQHENIIKEANSQMFDATINGVTIKVDGIGDDTLSQEYDAVAYAVGLYKPDTLEYKQMLSQDGLVIVLKSQSNNGADIVAVVRLEPQGLVINIGK